LYEGCKAIIIRKIKNGLVLIAILILFSIFAGLLAQADRGDIGAVIDTYEYDTTTMEPMGRHTLLRINNTDYYVSVLRGTDNDGYINTFHIYSDNGTIVKAVVQSHEYDITNGDNPNIAQIPNTGNYVIFYSDTSYCRLHTIPINDTGIIGSGIDSQDMTYNCIAGWNQDIIAFTNNIFLVVYPEASTSDGFIETWWIDNNGIINSTQLDIQEFDPVYGVMPCVTKVDSNTVAITYKDASSTGNFTVVTYNISSSGLITDAQADNWVYETDEFYYSSIDNIGTNKFALTYIDNGYDINCKTLNISDDGVITKSFIDTLEILGIADGLLATFIVDDPIVYTNGVMGCTVQGIASSENDGYLYTWNVSSNGTLGNAVIDTYEYDTTSSNGYAKPIHMNGNNYVIGYSDIAGLDGHLVTLDINTTPPVITLSNPIPANGAVNVNLNQNNVSILVNDSFGQLMTISMLFNGNYTNFTNVNNGTYQANFATPLLYNNTYFWDVNVTDVTIWTNATYSFTTITNVAPVVSLPVPYDAGTDISIFTQNLSVLIMDNESDLFYAEINCSNGDKWSAEDLADGFYALNITNPLQQNTTYTWWVNVTDGYGGGWTNETYMFTTENVTFTISNENPLNESINISKTLANWSVVVNSSVEYLNYSIEIYPSSIYQIMVSENNVTNGTKIISLYEIYNASYDFNGDGQINQADTDILSSKIGQSGAPGWIPEDLNSDGHINALDISLMLNAPFVDKLLYNNTITIFVNVSYYGSTSNQWFTFTTEAGNISIISDPLPLNTETGVTYVLTNISVLISDPDNDNLQYNMTLGNFTISGTANNTVNGTRIYLNISNLTLGTTYQWIVNITDGSYIVIAYFNFTIEYFHVDFNYTIVDLTVHFYSTVYGDISYYVWSFGDAGFSNDANPIHTYARGPANYTAMLKVENATTNDIAVRTHIIPITFNSSTVIIRGQPLLSLDWTFILYLAFALAWILVIVLIVRNIAHIKKWFK
jgi:hypothetical protein